MEELRDGIIKHLKLAVLMEFDSDVSDWISINWKHINEYTHKLCKGKHFLSSLHFQYIYIGFALRGIKSELE